MEEPYDQPIIKHGEENYDDFGYVKRDSELLEKVLTRKDPSPKNPPDDDPDNKSTGSQEQQVDPSPSIAPETSGNDEQERDVISGARLDSISEDHVSSSHEGDVIGDGSADETDGFKLVRKLGGTLNDAPELEQFKTVYDASKRKETVASLKSNNSKNIQGILRKMSSTSIAHKQHLPQAPTAPKDDDLPQQFQVKFLGQRDARGLWGIKHTRRPVDSMVAAAKNLKAGTVLPIVKLVISREGVSIVQMSANQKKSEEVLKFHPIDTISYGVQDLVYTRVFSMIIVKEIGELKDQHPFECHAFVCESRNSARKLTYALASAFHEYSKLVKARNAEHGEDGLSAVRKRFAIDLRSPEQIEADLRSPQADDSEA